MPVIERGRAGLEYRLSKSHRISPAAAAGALFTQSFAETLGTPGLSEVLALLRQKVFSETTSLSETLVKKVKKPFAETLSLSEAFAKRMLRSFAETLNSFTETLTTKRVFKRAFDETLTLAETLVKKVKKVFAETASLSEALVKKVKVSFAEAVSLAETLTTVFIPSGPVAAAGRALYGRILRRWRGRGRGR